jgi:hypothetical protein
MTQVFGYFIEKTPSKGALTLEFSPESIPVNEYWRNNDLSANFIADFLTTFIIRNDKEAIDNQRQLEIKSAASYIANELLENAVKYCQQSAKLPITVKLYLDKNKIRFFITNSLSLLRAANLQAVIYQLNHSDPNELYIAQLEKNAVDEYSSKSGLGFLSMINDYSAKLGWKFETIEDKPQVMSVTTMVELVV